MTFSVNGMSEFADGDFANFPYDAVDGTAEFDGDIFRTIRGTENSKLANQKQAITILKATEAAILEKGLAIEAKTYFEALFPLLDDEKRDAAMKHDQNRIIEFNTAICYLLAFVFPRLDGEYLREIYTDGALYSTISHAMRRFHLIAPFVRSMCVVVGSVLAAHADADWKEEKSSLGELFVSLLGWSVDARPKVRRAAQDTLMKLISGGECPEAVEFTTEFVSSALLNATRKDPSAAIQLFPLLKQLFPKLNNSLVVDGVDNLVTGLLNSLNLGNTHLTCSGYEIIQSYAQEQVEMELNDEIIVDRERLSRIYGIVKRIGEGMMKNRPTVDLVELSVGFLGALAQVTLLTLRLQSLLQKERFTSLQGALQAILSDYFMKSADGKVLNAAGSALLALFFGLFDRMDSSKWTEENVVLLRGTALTVLLAPEFGGLIVPQQGRLLQDAFVSLRLAAFLPVLARLIEILGDAAIPSLGPLILQLARLHDCRYLNCREDLVRVMSVLIRVSGLSETLKLIPLNLIRAPGVEEAPKAWLLPVLRDSVYNTSLRCWMQELLPVAEQVGERAASLRAAEKIQESRVWETLQAQIFSILPAVLSSFPVDFSEAFSDLSQLIARLLNDDAQLRPTLMAALQRFIQNSRSLMESLGLGAVDEIGLLRPVTLPQVEADLSTLTGAMPQFLPILFNIYAATTRDDPAAGDEDDSAAASSDLTLRLVETFLGLTEEGVVSEYFAKTVMRIERMRDSGAWAMLGTVLELAGTMIPYASKEALLDSFIPAVLPLLSVSEAVAGISMQKKSYRVLGRALAREDVLLGCPFESLCATLMEAGESVHSAAKRGRFRVLSLMASELPDSTLLCIPQMLPEVLLGVKEVNHRTRTAAYDLIVAWGRRMSRGGEFAGFDGGLRSASLREYISMVLAGLAGNTPHMISATIMALARIIFEFAAMLKASGDGEIVSALTGDVAMLLQSPSREIVKSAISFVKVALVILDSETLSPLLPDLIAGLLQWSNVHHQQFKLQVRHLIERLVRRFGYERMEEVTPAEHHALLANIKKMRERKSRKQQTKKEQDQQQQQDAADAEGKSVISRAALSRASKKSQFLMADGGSSGALSNRARFEKALNDSESENDYNSDVDGGADSDGGAAEDKMPPSKSDKASIALSRKMSAVSLKSVTTQRLPNMSRKQQEQLKRQMMINDAAAAASKKRGRSGNDNDSDDNSGDDEDVRFGSDGKLHIGEEGQNNSALRDMDKIYRAAMTSFKRSADGKHVKFARGTKANRDDFDDDDDGEVGEGDHRGDRHNNSNNNINSSKSMAAFSGVSRKTSLSMLSGRSALSARPSAVSHAHSGTQFRAKPGSKGDAKRKGAQFDPYAYVPIQRKSGKHGGQKEDVNAKYYMKNGNKRSRK